MRTCLTLCRGLAVLGGLLLSASHVRPADPEKDAFHYNRLLGRAINLGNALEAPREGEWGLKLEADYFRLIKEAGFQSVRIPIRWSAHAQAAPPFDIEAKFFERVDWAIDQALSRDLVAVINVHHYDEVFKDPDKHLPRLTALWKQIATRYRDRPDRLYFELLNEPHDKLTDERWHAAIPGLLAAVRATNPKRPVIVGPGHWNNINNLDKLQLPKDDRMLIATVHYYSPFEFTHQGASWVAGSDKWKGRAWKGTPQELAAIKKDFDKAAAWAKANNRPLFLGEFGAYSAADLESRARWTRAVAREAERLGMSWAYWEFASGFGAYDRDARAWRRPLLEALIEKKP